MANISRYRFTIAIWAVVLVLAPLSPAIGAASATSNAVGVGSGGALGGADLGGGPGSMGAIGATEGPGGTDAVHASAGDRIERTMYTPEGESIHVTQTFERAADEGALVVTVDINASAVTDVGSYGGYVVSIPDDARVISRGDLSQSAFQGYDFQADENVVTARIQFRVDAAKTSDCSDDPNAYSSVDEGSWAFTSRYDNGAQVVLLYQGRTPPDIDIEQTLQPTGDGIGGSGFLYVGPHDEYTESFGEHDVTVVVPEAARDTVNVSKVFGTLRAASDEFDVGKRSTELLFFTPPAPVRQGGAAVGTWDESRMDAWVSADADFGETGNTWIHEYVHTRQAYRADYYLDGSGTNTSFLVEGGADYAAAWLSLTAGNTTFAEFYEDVNSSRGADAILADQPAFGCNGLAKYTKGRRVLAALDLKIRNATDGDRTFVDVFRKLNADEDSTVTYEEFKTAVEEVAGENFDDWLDKYVQTGAVPSIPENPYVFSPDDVDVDGDGLDTDAERSAGTDPFDDDSDHDGLADGREVNEFGTNPQVKDTDGDGVPDGIEVEHGMDPTSEHSDEDGLSDSVEWQDDALDPAKTDTDDDGLEDDEERERGTKPDVADSDSDGLEDGDEVRRGTNPLSADTDEDGLVDGKEVELGTDPKQADTDGDGLEDGQEVLKHSTDPTDADTDGDRVPDGVEVNEDDTDPTDESDFNADSQVEDTAGDDGAEDENAGADEEGSAGGDDAADNGGDGVVGPSTVPGFSMPAALAALLASALLLRRHGRQR